MPIIYSDDQMRAFYRRLMVKYPETAVIILTNGPMAYAFDASSRAIWRAEYPAQRARNRITLSIDHARRVADKLCAQGKEVGICDLDKESEPPI